MLISQKVVRAMRWDTAGSVGVAGLSFLTTVWIVRTMSEASYGLLVTLLATVSLGQLLANGGVKNALLRFVPEATRKAGTAAAASLVTDAFWLRGITLGLISLPFWLFPDFIAGALIVRPSLAPYLRWAPVLIATPLFGEILAAALIASFRQPTVRLSEVANKLVFAACVLTLPLWPDPIHAVIAAWILGGLAAVGWLTNRALRDGILRRPNGAQRLDRRRLTRFTRAAYGLSLVAFFLGRELDILLLTRLGLPAETVARYAVAFAFVTLAYRVPLLPIAGGFDQPLIAGLHVRGDHAALRRLFRAYFEYIFIFVLPIMAGGIILGGDLVREIYGADYGETRLIIAALLLAVGLSKLSGINGPFLLATDRERTMLRLRVFFSGVNVIAALAAIPLWGAGGAVLATSASLIGLTASEAVVVARFLRQPYPSVFLTRTLGCTLAMAAVLALLRPAAGPEPGLIIVMALVITGALVYGGMLLWLRPVDPQQAAILQRGGVGRLARLVARISRPTGVETESSRRISPRVESRLAASSHGESS